MRPGRGVPTRSVGTRGLLLRVAVSLVLASCLPGTASAAGDGTAWAWGLNEYGQLGDNTTTDRHEPVQVHDLTGVVAIAAGTSHSLALKSDGTAWAWGGNHSGQLGDNTTTSERHAPVQVHNLTGVVAIAAGLWHSLAVKSDGTAWAWGDNIRGQLGDNTTTDRREPVQVHNLTGVVAIAGGYRHSLALKSDGTAWAWGRNDDGQLGDNTSTDRHEPVQVHNLTGVVAIAAGLFHSLAVKSDGTAWAWGNNEYGQLGDNTTTDRYEPVQVHNLTDVVAIAAGVDHSLALKSDGTAWAWGLNDCGQLGDNTTWTRREPVQVHNLTGVVALAAGAGAYHSLAVKSDGTAWAWGNNWYGQLGDGTSGWENDRHEPVQVHILTGVVAIAVGWHHSLATATQPPDPPTGVVASDGAHTDKVAVTWDPSDGATSYEVWRHTSDDPASATRLAASVIPTSYDDTTPTPGLMYYYWVKAANAQGTSAFSASDSGFRAIAGPASACVDDSNSTVQEDGSEQHPYNTIQEGVDAVGHGGTVKVAQGSYSGSLTIAGKAVTIQGGYVGGTEADYAGGLGGDFSEANRNTNPATNQTVIDGGGATAAVECQGAAAAGSTLEGFRVRNRGAILRGGVRLRRVLATSN